MQICYLCVVALNFGQGMQDIVVDLYKTKDLNSGLGQFSIQFGEEFVQRIPADWQVYFLVHQLKTKGTWSSDVKLIQANWRRRFLPKWGRSYALWHSLHQFPAHLPPNQTKWILTIHDLNFLVEKNTQQQARYLKKLQRNIDRATAITVISEYTKEQVQMHLDLKGKPIEVIPNGVSLREFEHATKPTFIQGKFFFSIGIFNAKKNFEVLLPIMSRFPDYKLVLAGNSDTKYGQYIKDQVVALGLQNQVILPGKISTEDKFWCYSNCTAFMFPSLAEGFGLPVIEAMLAGRPAFLSKQEALQEIGGEQAFYFDDWDCENMAKLMNEKLEEVSSNQNFSASQKAYAQQFSWNRAIEAYIQLYQKVIAFL